MLVSHKTSEKLSASILIFMSNLLVGNPFVRYLSTKGKRSFQKENVFSLKLSQALLKTKGGKSNFEILCQYLNMYSLKKSNGNFKLYVHFTNI